MNKEAAKQMLFEVVDIFNSQDVELFLHCGTLISAYRGYFQEGDEDLDFAVKHEVIVSKMGFLKEELKKHGYRMMIHSKPYIYERGMKLAKVFNGHEIHADIIDYALNEKDRFHPNYAIDYATVHEARFFENPKTINFLGRDFLIPTPVEDFLESIYGKDWRTPKVKCVFPNDYKNVRLNYWRSTLQAKAATMYHKRVAAAWQAYRIEMGNS